MARLPVVLYGADFETVVNTERTRVWLWGLESFDGGIFEYGTDIDSFMERISKISSTIYFHNLKFDVQFILYWLLTNGYKHVSSKQLLSKQFNTLISDMGLFYTIEVKFTETVKVKFIDSYKLIPISIAEFPKTFGLDIEKLEIDYEAVRELDHIPTKEEIEYVKHDVHIMVQGIKFMRQSGMKKMTAASNALNYYKGLFNKNEFDYRFPALTLSDDKDIRLSYKGGWTYLNPKYKDEMVGTGLVYDVNSMYPWAMKYCMLPFGPPVYYSGQYEQNDTYPLYIQSITCKFKLKQGKYPSIQLKGNFRFSDTEYITDCSEYSEILTLTNVDLNLFFENYDVWDLEYNCGFMMRGEVGMFNDYIDYWYGVKQQAKKDGNNGLYYIAKLMLNSLYGKFGSNPRKRSKYPYYNVEKDIVSYQLSIEEITTGGYVPVASFITSYARDKIIRAANMCGDRFIYADTDSIHVVGTEEPDIDIDSYRLGAFKLESKFEQAKFHRAKCYIESIDGNLDKKCAGLPKKAKELFGFDNMEPGAEFAGKLVPVNTPGGVVLVERKFTIK